jgi:hypothetical protein
MPDISTAEVLTGIAKASLINRMDIMGISSVDQVKASGSG